MSQYALDPLQYPDVAFALATSIGFDTTKSYSAPGLRYLKNGNGTSVFITHFVSESGAEVSTYLHIA